MLTRLLQKTCQLTVDEHVQLMDMVCFWVWVQPKLSAEISNEEMERLEGLWRNGHLAIL